eukprot:3181479-Pyramimonas_sp.AAC.1
MSLTPNIRFTSDHTCPTPRYISITPARHHVTCAAGGGLGGCAPPSGSRIATETPRAAADGSAEAGWAPCRPVACAWRSRTGRTPPLPAWSRSQRGGTGRAQGRTPSGRAARRLRGAKVVSVATTGVDMATTGVDMATT